MYIMFTDTYVYIPVADLEGACGACPPPPPPTKIRKANVIQR